MGAFCVSKGRQHGSKVFLISYLGVNSMAFSVSSAVNGQKLLYSVQPVYLHSLNDSSLSSHSLRSSKGVTLCWSIGSRPTQVQRYSTLACLPFGTTSRYLSIQPLRLQAPGNISRHISGLVSFPYRHLHARWYYRNALWIVLLNGDYNDSTIPPLSLATPGNWCYRNLIDWLIDWSINTTSV